jgi:type II secretory pathway pseudopilin PulG
MHASQRGLQHGSQHAFKHAQRGVSLSGLIVVLAILGVIAVLAMKIFPTFVEYRAVKAGIASARALDGTVREMQSAFNKNAEINMIESIAGRDLIVTRDGGEVHLSFSYEKRIPLFTNVDLAINYSGTTDPSGIIPDKPTEDTQ